MSSGALIRGLPPWPPWPDEEAGRDLLVRAQAALLDQHPAGARRSLLELHDLLVPFLDRALGQTGKEGPSSRAGMLGLYRELPDIDAERESLPELLLRHAAALEVEAPESGLPELDREALRALLEREPAPRSLWWRRLCRGAAGPLGDRARVQVQRGDQVILERLPAAEGRVAGADGPDYSPRGLPLPSSWRTELLPLRHGDRLTLQLLLPLPGRLAVLHALSDETEEAAELALLLPQQPGEEAPRRALETVELVGEVETAAGTHALVPIWVPELLPAAWAEQALSRRRLPPQARPWFYRYRVS